MLSRVLNHVLIGWPNYLDDDELEPYFRRKDGLSVDQGCIFWGLRVVIPTKCRPQLVNDLHGEHQGIVRMKGLARSYLWCPGIDSYIEELVGSCKMCLSCRKTPPTGPLIPWKYPSYVWERLHIGFAEYEGTNYLVVVDSYSKWLEVFLHCKYYLSESH